MSRLCQSSGGVVCEVAFTRWLTYLSHFRRFVEEGVHPQIIIRNIRSASTMAVQKVKDLAVEFDINTEEGEGMLLKTASTALNSKLIATHQDLFAPMIVDAVKSLSADVDGLDDLRGMIGIKKIPGGRSSWTNVLFFSHWRSLNSSRRQVTFGHHFLSRASPSRRHFRTLALSR